MNSAWLAAPMRTVSTGHGLVEAPVALGNGFVVADATSGQLLSVDATGAVVAHAQLRRGIGGAARHRDGGFVITGSAVRWMRADGDATVLVGRDLERGWLGYNDMDVDVHGRVYVGAFAYRPSSAETPVPGCIVRLADGESPRVVAGGVFVPNGIAVDEDAGEMFVVDSLRRCVLRFALDAVGPAAPTPASVSTADVATSSAGIEVARFATMPDGMAHGPDGTLWVAAGGDIVVLDPVTGDCDRVRTPAGFVTSVAFGGHDARTVLVAAAPSASDPTGSILLGRARAAAPIRSPAWVRVVEHASPTSADGRRVDAGALADVACQRCGSPWSAGPGRLGAMTADGELVCDACWVAAEQVPIPFISKGQMP